MNISSSNENENQSRGARRRARTRADLLAAARKVFALRGYHEASIAEITHAADVGVGTFYLHFHDKDALFNTVLEEGFQELREHVMETIRQQPEARTLTLIVCTVFRHAYEQRELFLIALTGESQHIRPRTIRSQAALAEGLTHILEDARSRGYLTEYEIPLLARLITGVITQAIFWWFEHDEPGPDQMAEQVLRLLSKGLPAVLFTEEKTS